MALVLLEGFDHEATKDFSEAGVGNSGNQLAMKGWSTSGDNHYFSGRLPYSANSRSFGVVINSGLSRTLASSYGELVVGFGFKVTGGSGHTFLALSASGGGTVCSLVLNTRGQIAVVDSVSHTVATGPSQLRQDVWYYVEVKLVVGTSGSVEVHLNGLSGEIASTTGNFGTSDVDTLSFQWQALAGRLEVDDVYALDPASGATNTDFLGDICVETLYPVSDGTYTAWTPDSGSSHYTRVDEGQLDGDTSYVHATTAGAKDSYGIGDPSLNPTTVYGVQLNIGARKNDAGAHTIKPLIRQGGVDYLGPTSSLGAAYAFDSWLLDQDPGGSDWTYSTVNGDEYGVELAS